MAGWFLKGLATGTKTTCYPTGAERIAGVSPGRPVGGDYPEHEIPLLVARCPVGAIRQAARTTVTVDYRRCIHCFRCTRGLATPLAWEPGYEWAGVVSEGPQCPLGSAYQRSLNVLVVDTGDCGACLNEVKQLNNPYYNMHRLGFFITPTPRQADVMLVVGPLTDQMRLPLRKTYEAMPTPKRVVAVGTCALSGGVFAPSFACGAGPADLLPVDVAVPGNPPPPLAILHGLLVAVGRKSPVSLESPAQAAAQEAPAR
ncbi:MAG: hypothetical protein ACLQNE_03845 [Thermoguttaceae bacterium]